MDHCRFLILGNSRSQWIKQEERRKHANMTPAKPYSKRRFQDMTTPRFHQVPGAWDQEERIQLFAVWVVTTWTKNKVNTASAAHAMSLITALLPGRRDRKKLLKNLSFTSPPPSLVWWTLIFLPNFWDKHVFLSLSPNLHTKPLFFRGQVRVKKRLPWGMETLSGALALPTPECFLITVF